MDALEKAFAALAAAQEDYSSQRTGAAELLARAQLRREEAMRLVAALGVSHRRIGELTSLSHTRVNQILGTGRLAIPEAHMPSDFGGGPKTTRSAIIRLMATRGPHSWSRDEIRDGLVDRRWPMGDLETTITALAAEGSTLAADQGCFTIHTYDRATPRV
jgi:hypothetical protein